MMNMERYYCRSDNYLLVIVADSVIEEVQNCHIAKVMLYGGLSHAGSFTLCNSSNNDTLVVAYFIGKNFGFCGFKMFFHEWHYF